MRTYRILFPMVGNVCALTVEFQNKVLDMLNGAYLATSAINHPGYTFHIVPGSQSSSGVSFSTDAPIIACRFRKELSNFNIDVVAEG